MTFWERQIHLDAIFGSVYFYKVRDAIGFLYVSSNTDIYAAVSIDGRQLTVSRRGVLAFMRDLSPSVIFDEVQQAVKEYGYTLLLTE